MKIKIKLFISFSFVLAVFICFGFSSLKPSIVVRAEQDHTTEQHTHCFCGGNISVGNHLNHEDKTYSPWSGGDFNYDGEDGNIGTVYLYLTSDVVTDSNSCNRVTGSGILEISENQIVYLCLNGHSLRNGKTTDNAIDVMGSLYLCDCVGGGTIGGRTSGSSSGSVWVSNGVFNMYSGTLTGSYGVKNGAGIYVKGNSLVNMYGGKITGNIATRQGGGVFLSKTSTFVMYDGEISNNSAPNYGGGVVVDDGSTFTMYGGKIINNMCGGTGGGVFVSGGEFIMNGGTISNNEAANGGGVATTYDVSRGNFTINDGTISDNIAFGVGGGVYIWDRGDLLMYGGSISGNKAAYGGGVGIFSAEKDNKNINNVFNLYAGEIKNNTATKLGGGICCFQYSVLNLRGDGKIVVTENTESNLYFADACTLNIDKLADGSMIGVSALTNPEKGKPTSIYSGSGINYSEYFFSDSSDYILKFSESGIALTSDFFTSTIKYETGCEQEIPDQVKTGFTETMELIITDVKPTMPCHEFLGWSQDPNADSAQYNVGDTLNVLGELTLYAIWKDSPHKLTLVAEVKATCEQDGVKEHHVCSECGKKFIETSDGSKLEVTSDEQLTLPGGHKFGHWQETIEATTEAEGVLAHKDCEICKKHFDANDIEITDLTIAKLPKPTTSKKSSSTAAAVGITAGSLLGLEALAYIIFRLIRKKQNNI